MNTVKITLTGNKGTLSGPPVLLKKVYDRLRIKHPNAWYLMQRTRGKWDGYVEYLSDYGDFQIGLLNHICKQLKELDSSVRIIIQDNRLKLPIKPKMVTRLGNYQLRDIQKDVIKSFINNSVEGHPFYIGVINAATNSGKCIGKDSLVNTEKGLIRIKDLVNLPYKGEIDCKHRVYNHLGKKVFTSRGCNSGRIKAIRIITKKGYKLIGGYHNHRIYTWINGKFDWVYLRDLTKGQLIPIKHSLKYKGVLLNEYLTPEIAYSLGALHGDGCIKTRGFSISGQDYEIANHLVKTFPQMKLKIKPHRKFEGFNISHKSEEFSKLISCFPELIGTSHTKNIPNGILSAPLDIQAQYIAGLFDTDGAFTKKRGSISFSSVNEQVIDDLMVILLNFGIICRKDKKKTSWQNGKSHTFRIHIQSQYRDIFFKNIPMKVKRKTSDTPLGYARTSFDISPKDILEEVVKQYPSRRFNQKVRRGSNIGFPELQRYLGDFPVKGKLKEYLDFTKEDIFWDRIKSIEIIKEECYDIHVPKGNSYIANGFINHNTLLMSAIHECFQRKLRTLVIINNSQIFAQAKKEYREYLPGEDIQFIQGKNLKFGNFNVGMVQTMSQKIKEIRNELSKIDIVLVDEADVADNKQFKTVLSYLYNVRIRLGLSGSIYMSKLKKDLIHNMNLRSFFGDEIHIITKQDMVKKGYSTPVIIKITEGNSHNPHLVADGWLDTFKKAVIEDPVAKKKSAERVLYNIKYNRLPAIIVTRFIEHAESLYKYYTNHPELKDYNIRVIDHTSKNRESIINQFAQGKIDVLITTYIIKRGINLPLAVYLQNAAGSDSEEDISQICGRMERTFKGKKKSYLDDMYYYGQYLERHSKHRINYYIRTGMKVINLKKKRNGKL